MLRRARLVTLTGTAGVGKTRTALELARGQARRRADGVWLVDLASCGGQKMSRLKSRGCSASAAPRAGRRE